MSRAKKGPRCPLGQRAQPHAMTGDRDLYCMFGCGVLAHPGGLQLFSLSQIRCMLNIWGVILYLRLPWITAQAGIGECHLSGEGRKGRLYPRPDPPGPQS